MSVIVEETPQDAARRLAQGATKGRFTLEALHVYTDANGSPDYYRWRVRQADGMKVIRPMHRKGSVYVAGEPPAPFDGKRLYGLHELLAADPGEVVIIAEGEWCVDHLQKLGLVATTSGGASSPGGADWTPLRGRHCVLWPDHDERGRKYVEEVATILRELNCTVELIDVDPLGLPDKGDCVEWLEQHPDATAGDVLALSRCELMPNREKITRQFMPHVELIAANGIEPEPIRWLWPGYLAKGKLHVLAGAPGTGKTTIAMAIAAAITAGSALPSGWKPKAGAVLVWSGEDDPKDTLVPRLIAAGADRDRVYFVGDTHDEYRRPFDPARDVDLLAEVASTIGDISMIVVDPLVSAVSGDSHKNAEVRRGLAPLVDLAARLDAALLGITHYSKGTGGRDPLERVTGSIAFGALARVVLGTVRMEAEEGQPQKMMMARAKSNIGPDGGGFIYAFEQVDLDGHPGVSASKIVWGAAVEGSARELLAEPDMEGDRQAPARNEAGEFLRELLEPGPVATDDVKAEAKKAGLSWATVRRAKDAIGARSRKIGFADAQWFWTLPDPKQVEDAQTTLHPVAVSTFATGGHLRSTARVSEDTEGAQFIEGAEGAHVDRMSTSVEHLPGEGFTL